MKAKNFVSKRFFLRHLGVFKAQCNKLIRHNQALKAKLDQIVTNQRHYLRARLPRLKDKENYRREIVRQARMAKRVLDRLKSRAA